MSHKLLHAAVALTALAFAGCGDAAFDEAERPWDPDFGVGPGPGDDAGLDTAGDAGPDVFVPEQPEDDFRLQPPAVGQTYVYVANTDLNAVARIDSLTLEVRTLDVGLRPTLVRTVPGGDMALVLNQGSHDVTVIAAEAGVATFTLEVMSGANSLLIAPNGDYAFAWYDDRRARAGDVAGSLNDVTLLALEREPARAYNLVVGLHVREIEFDAAGETAFLVTDDGISVVPLAGVDRDRFVPPIRVSNDPAEDARALDREVEVTPSGAFALVRTSNASNLRLVDLASGAIREIELGGVPTDVDLLEGGERAVVLLREQAELLVVAIPGAFEGEGLVRHSLGDEVAGLALPLPLPGGTRLALYSTLDENDHLTLFDLADGSFETWALRKGIESVFATPDGSRLLVLHTKVPGEPVPGTPGFLARSFGYTIFSLDTRTARLVLTEARPGDFTFSADGTQAFLLLNDPARSIRAVEWVNLTTGRDQTLRLRRAPEAIGVIPATGRVFVSQEHEVGRIAFIDPATGEVREVTGYHLNSRTE
jgi:DNA-binding beta-propeller fold protein YncE